MGYRRRNTTISSSSSTAKPPSLFSAAALQSLSASPFSRRVSGWRVATRCDAFAGEHTKKLKIGEYMRRWIAALAVTSFALAPCWAHVGSPDVYFQGLAGAYHLTVTIRTPAMIPGVADVEVRSADPGVSSVRVVPLYIVGPGAKYPPPPDPLAQSKEDPQFFSGKIWLMESGSWQVRVAVNR